MPDETKAAPVGVTTGRGRESYGPQQLTPALRGGQALFCARDGSRVTTRFPHRCPLATARPLRTIGRLQALAWEKIGAMVPPDLSDGLAFLGWSDVCFRCVAENAAHATVRRLREAGHAE